MGKDRELEIVSLGKDRPKDRPKDRQEYIKEKIRKYGENWREHIKVGVSSENKPPIERERPQKTRAGDLLQGGGAELRGGGRAVMKKGGRAK